MLYRPLVQPKLKLALAQSVSPGLSVLTAGGQRPGQSTVPEGAVFYAPFVNSVDDALGAPATFQRNSPANYRASPGGPFASAGNDVARFESPGLLMEFAATNLFLNSVAPATQSISLGTGQHTFAVYGSGSVTSSDAGGTATGHGTATDGSPVLINVTGAGNIQFAVSGTPDYVQVETGAIATSPITTAGTSATRAVELLEYQENGFFNAPEGMILITVLVGWDNSIVNTGNRVRIAGLNPGTNGLLYARTISATQLRFASFDGTTFQQQDVNPNIDATVYAAVRWKTSPSEFNLGVRSNGAWTWDTQDPYSGSFPDDGQSKFYVASTNDSRIHLRDLTLYDEDRGRSWIESNYPF